MKSFTVLFAVFGTAAAGISKPDVSIGLNVGHDTATGPLGGVEPRVKWQTEGSVAGFDMQGGIDVTVTDVKAPPSAFVWGKLKRAIPDIGVFSIRGDMDANERDFVDLDFQASAFGTGLQITGSGCLKSNDFAVDNLQLTKTIDALGGKLSLNPRYDISRHIPDATVGYSHGATSMKIDAQKKKLTVSYSFANRDTITPSVSASGDFSLSYTRDLADGKLTTTWTPDDSIKFEWTDGGWDATIVAPLEGFYTANGGIKVSMKRNIDVPL